MQRTQKIARLAFSLCVSLTLWLALSREASSPMGAPDKLNHLVAFFVLSVLLDYALLNVERFRIKALLLGGFGFLIEILQLWVGYRSFEWGDLAADCAGILCYVLLRRELRASIDRICSRFIG